MNTKVKTMTMTESPILDANVIELGDRPNVDVKRAEAALSRALARLKSAMVATQK